jgi:hypothetical protein
MLRASVHCLLPGRWDEPKFPLRRPVKETIEKITEIMAHLEDDLKVRAGACRIGQFGRGLDCAGT